MRVTEASLHSSDNVSKVKKNIQPLITEPHARLGTGNTYL